MKLVFRISEDGSEKDFRLNLVGFITVHQNHPVAVHKHETGTSQTGMKIEIVNLLHETGTKITKFSIYSGNFLF